MLALAGVWAATQAPPAVVNQWIQPANDPWPRFAVPAHPIDETMHYFLVVSASADGTLRAFVRNPEANVGAFIGTRTLVADGATLRLVATGKRDVAGRVNSDGTLTIGLPGTGDGLVFHRPMGEDLRWFYPRAAARGPIESRSPPPTAGRSARRRKSGCACSRSQRLYKA